MKLEITNLFSQPAIEILGMVTGFSPLVGEEVENGKKFGKNCVYVLIGITGSVYGNIVFKFRSDMACKIASAMMCGMPVNEMDEMSMSAVAELCNMIMGNVALQSSYQNINIDITPPNMISGEDIHLYSQKSESTSIPIIFEDKVELQIEISIVDKK